MAFFPQFIFSFRSRNNLQNGSSGILREWAQITARDAVVKNFGFEALCRVELPVHRVEIVDHAIDQQGACDTFREHKRIATKRPMDFSEPLWHTRAACDACHLRLKHLGGDGRFPEHLEGHRLLEVLANLFLQKGVGNRRFEGNRRSELVRVIHALDGPLCVDTLLESQIAGQQIP
ncbi:MAG: hypothetical protein L0Z52_08815 [Acidobacteria bacterium]|nr:hypothetical protein [Acidobacteriota bacterium]